MKKKILALCLVVALLATAIAGATLAYFTDADKDVNVMVTGNVQIVQNETERDGSAYEDGQKLAPAVYGPNGLIDPTVEFDGPDGNKMKMHTDDTVKNALDKVVSVTNKGSEAAYIRTIVLIENNDSAAKKLHILYNNDGIDVWHAKGEMDPDGDGTKSWYDIFTFTYQAPLASKATSAPSLKQVWLDPAATNEDAAKLVGADGKLDIYALSQAVQVDGFADAATALTAAFGELTEDNVGAWFAAADIDTTGAANVVG